MIKTYKISVCLVMLIALLFFNCATHKTSIAKTDAITLRDIDPVLKVYMIGGVGISENDEAPTALQSLEIEIKNATKSDLLLFLGDNVYPKGIPNQDGPEKEAAEQDLSLQIDLAKKFPGRVIFIPGNQDWYSGVSGLKQQEKLVEKALGKHSFLPEDSCPMKKVKINDDTILLVLDSQWYITNWDRHPKINEHCNLKTRTDFLDEFRSEIKKARGKTVLVAIHQPMFSSGPHGGQHSLSSHLTPVPLVGSLKNLMRNTSGIYNTDLSNVFYNELKRNLVAASQQNNSVIFISGHEQNLQYLVKDNIPQIISGSGSRTSATRLIKGAKFAYPDNGFAVLNIFKDGASEVKFISAKDREVVYQTEVFKSDSKIISSGFPIIRQDSIMASVYSVEETKKGGFYKFLWGERYRKYFSEPVTAKVAYLDTLMGGLTPLRKGGGTQSKTLHLKAADGTRFVMRAVEKNAAQYIQSFAFKDQYVEGSFENTVSEALVKDVFTGSYPYAPFIVASLSKDLNIPYLNSNLYYIPKQDALGNYNDEYGDELYVFEEHPSKGHLHLATGNFTGNIISTTDVLLKINEDESKIVDEPSYIKARLFDMVIGDWDRHHDQWRWLEFQEDNKMVYKALPRDRDQAFSKMSDGFLLGASIYLIPVAKLLRKYASDLKDVKGFNIEPFPLDMALIVQSNKEVWDQQVAAIQNDLTDAVIDDAFNTVPKEVQGETIESIKELLKGRRRNLQSISDAYYKLINEYAVVVGTNKEDYIKVNGLENGDVEVTVFRKKGDSIKESYHNRTYSPKLTKELWIYGLDDSDTFEITGTIKKMKIGIIGGQNNDEYIVEDGKNIKIYDYKSRPNTLNEVGNASVKLQDNYSANVYDYKKLRNNTNRIIPSMGLNPDDGLKLGATNVYTRYGFERNPFTSQHKMDVAYYFATSAFEFKYQGEFAHIIGNLNLKIDAHYQSSNYTFNFFGYGNETINLDDDLGFDYNRVRMREFLIKPSFIYRANGGSKFSLGVGYESVKVENTENRYVSESPEVPSYIFESNQYASVTTKFEFKNYDNNAYPTLGFESRLEFGYKINLHHDNIGYTYLIPELSFTHKLVSSGKFVLATRIKSQINFGENFEFYQAASIGGTDGLRGFRNQRFTGNQSFFQNTDIRYSFGKFRTKILPIRVGVFTGFDYGRVWLKGEDTHKWHNSYGGGFFISGVDIISANLGVFHSMDGFRVAFALGFAL
ncbi:metallophosphoesterase [Gelidibacter mesophilus]|uniref:metallophosphoesterase n=1 Tax=Gelidibacter mesophilus TaxID=169050 RepID=UPI00042914B8|nr:metallophosphoesterase [Gelidibacter mesophilus]